MEKLYTPQEVADYLGFTISTVNTYIFDGRIKSVKVFNSRRVKESELQNLIKESDRNEEVN